MAVIAILLLVALFSIKYLIYSFLMLKSLITAIMLSAILTLVYKLVCSKIAKRVAWGLKSLLKKWVVILLNKKKLPNVHRLKNK